MDNVNREDVSGPIFKLLGNGRDKPLMPKEAYEFAKAHDKNYGISFDAFEKVFWSVMNNAMAYALHSVITEPNSKVNYEKTSNDKDIFEVFKQKHPQYAYDDVDVLNRALFGARQKKSRAW